MAELYIEHEQKLEREVMAELEVGNWPSCFACQRVDKVGYMGIVVGSPTFVCTRCSAVFAMDLRNPEDA